MLGALMSERPCIPSPKAVKGNKLNLMLLSYNKIVRNGLIFFRLTEM